MRNLRLLPKAHLHLHFTGSMTPELLGELATEQGIRLPPSLLNGVPVSVENDKRGWFRFQRLYDAARAVVRSEATMRRVLDAAAANDAAEGSKRMEIQIDPTSYAPFVGGITPALEIVLDEAATASAKHGIEVGVIVAASRVRHPLEARTLARLAAKFAGVAPGQVIGFGLSNDERTGHTKEFEPAFRIARAAGLAAVPHSGELRGPRHVENVLDFLNPTRLGHGVRASENEEVLARIVEDEIALEVCPASNVALGVYPTLAEVPLPQLVAAGATVALGADDPLLFGSRLNAQYESAREVFGFSDAKLAKLASDSIQASLASPTQKQEWQKEVQAWLQTTPPVILRGGRSP